jgi:hypothetical protein
MRLVVAIATRLVVHREVRCLRRRARFAVAATHGWTVLITRSAGVIVMGCRIAGGAYRVEST